MAATAFGHPNKVQIQQPTRQRVIDLVHLAKQTLGDRSLEQEVLRMFDQMVCVYYKNTCDAQSAEDLKLNLHSLKGAASGVGATGISKAARSAEIELDEIGSVRSESISDLGFAVEEARGFIAELLDDEVAI